MRLLSAIPLLMLACRPQPVPASADVVEQFYGILISSGTTGAPTPAALATLAPLLSDTLEALLAGARRRFERDSATTPDEKPAFAEGDLFSSLFEGPSSAVVTGDDSGRSARRVTVRLEHAGSTPPLTWSDTVVLIRERDRYVIDDVIYGGDWAFAARGTLRAGLASALGPP